MKVGRGKARRTRAKPPKPGQLPLWKPRGGKRRGAGRKPKGPRAGSPHKARPELKARHPVHVVLRTVAAVRSLRRRHTYQAIRWATLTTARREDFRIVHLSIQRTHIHLLVEADGKGALSAGMQGFQISAAKHLNRAISKGRPGPRRRGTVFPDRYHAEIITTPTQARHTLSYVLNNWRKHGEPRHEMARTWKVDWFSTAAMFPGWAEYGDEPEERRHFLWKGPATYDPLIVYQPRTWLLREGWKKAGPISKNETPSATRSIPRNA
ncbi:MAG TPA: transposase [Kofleriaceae bacterium]|nr:transposase [Kofleriaceae bacterium]